MFIAYLIFNKKETTFKKKLIFFLVHIRDYLLYFSFLINLQCTVYKNSINWLQLVLKK